MQFCDIQMLPKPFRTPKTLTQPSRSQVKYLLFFTVDLRLPYRVRHPPQEADEEEHPHVAVVWLPEGLFDQWKVPWLCPNLVLG